MSLSNGQIYRKTFVFSWLRLLLDLVATLIMVGCAALGYAVLQDKFIGMAGGLAAGILVFWLIVHFFGYVLKAGQIAMMTRGVTEGALPADVVASGKQEVKSRFATVAAYYAITSAIHAIFREITNGINSLSKAGGDAVKGVGDTISGIISIAVEYLCDCCLGWVFYKKGQSAFKGTCQGAVLFFKNWKTLLKNMGRVFAIGTVSFIVIGGALMVGYSFLLGNFPQFVTAVAKVLAEVSTDASDLASDPEVARLVVAMLFAILSWSVLHEVFVKPFVLVGVLRNYMGAGIASEPGEDSFAQLDGMSPKFRQIHEKADAQA